MTPTDLRAALATLGWSQRGLADHLARPEGTVRQWARGALPVPPDTAAWLAAAAIAAQPLASARDALAGWLESNPPPTR